MICVSWEPDGTPLWAVPQVAEHESFSSVKLCVGCLATGYIHQPTCALECNAFQPNTDCASFLFVLCVSGFVFKTV